MGSDQGKTLTRPWGMFAFLWLCMAALTGVGYFVEWHTGSSSGRVDAIAIALGILAVILVSFRLMQGPIRQP